MSTAGISQIMKKGAHCGFILKNQPNQSTNLTNNQNQVQSAVKYLETHSIHKSNYLWHENLVFDSI